MRVLLDTHVRLWLTLKPDLMPTRLAALLRRDDHQVLVSAASAWEFSVKCHLGKLPEGAPLIANFEGGVSALGADLLAIDHAHARRAGELDWSHRDPFDRVLVAQAQVEGLRWATLGDHIRRFVGAPLLEVL